MEDQGEGDRLTGIDIEDIDGLLSFLNPLDFDGDREKSSEVTVTNWPVLLEHCQPDDDDLPMVKDMKMTVVEELHLMELISLIDNCKNLVKFLKQSELINRQTKSVKQEIEVRWNSITTLLTSIDEVWDEVRYSQAICILYIPIDV